MIERSKPRLLSNGRFANPWPDSSPSGTPLAMLKWQWQRVRHGVPKPPSRDRFAIAKPEVGNWGSGELRITWLGQSGFLLQFGDVNLLVDPLLSERASPFRNLGPKRVVSAPFTVATLPQIHAVIMSHDHYDHLDSRTHSDLFKRFGDALEFHAPLRFADWFGKLGIRNVHEYDWWQRGTTHGLKLLCTPAQHWSRRTQFDLGKRLWSSWRIETCPPANLPTSSLFFCGDSGYCPAFKEIHDETGSVDVALMPIGAYEPRWFMKPAHMNPEEAVQSFVDLGAREFVGMHWGTFRLTDEPMLEPPERVVAEWRRRGLPESSLHIPAHGETLTFK